MDFDNIEYLKIGNEKQKCVYHLLIRYQILAILCPFDPIVVGTIPIEIDIESSDIDIICYVIDEREFIEKVTSSFSDKKGFKLKQHCGPDHNAVLANFRVDGFAIEIFGQNLPTRQQVSYKHMLIEYNVLLQKRGGFPKENSSTKKARLKNRASICIIAWLNRRSLSIIIENERLTPCA
jgi:hypothetical protein